MRIGILALQGAVREHSTALRVSGVTPVPVLNPEDLDGLDGLIIPGGESTTMGKLMVRYNLLEPVAALGRSGFPIFGTCAGMVMLSRHILHSDQHCLGLMDTYVERNAFGRQSASFEADMAIPALGGNRPFHAVFIRAPYITKVEKNVEVLLAYEDRILFVRQGSMMATAFHPELTDDIRVHEYFIRKIIKCND
jgi:5'-phosphate synthase pdxT subunit